MRQTRDQLFNFFTDGHHNFVLGGVYAFSYFKTPLMAQYHWDPATLALAFSINMGIIPLP
ncbi:hypothetical protein MJN39_24730, partial [Salmonella enterica subsp. enterica serovar Kentucky]|nr:hypothetical protein [Salmonella enterica subsp. enterica serovar Kentucky]